jgi:hypothetical protein
MLRPHRGQTANTSQGTDWRARNATRGGDPSRLALEGTEDTFLRFIAFQRNQTGESLYVTACLTATFRSQGFSPSQRFGPHLPLRLCFTPHPLIGFGPSELFPPKSADMPFDTSCSLALGVYASLYDLRARQHNPSTERLDTASGLQSVAPTWCPTLQATETAARSRCSPGLHPLRGMPTRWLTHKGLPSCTWAQMVTTVARRRPPVPCTTGYFTNRIWTLLPKE